ARRYSLDLHRHVAGTKLGVPGAFFYLIEKVEADLYFFCDHDDIWEAGKIDATANVASLEVPAFYFSEPKLFTTEAPDELFRYFHHLGVSVDRALDARSAFFFNPAVGNTVAVNRELRNIYLHQATQARDGAAMHDWWFY